MQQGQKFKILANLPFFTGFTHIHTIFSRKKSLPQRQILTIGVTFQVLSIDNVKNEEKVVQQGQKLRILLNSIKLP